METFWCVLFFLFFIRKFLNYTTFESFSSKSKLGSGSCQRAGCVRYDWRQLWLRLVFVCRVSVLFFSNVDVLRFYGDPKTSGALECWLSFAYTKLFWLLGGQEHSASQPMLKIKFRFFSGFAHKSVAAVIEFTLICVDKEEKQENCLTLSLGVYWWIFWLYCCFKSLFIGCLQTLIKTVAEQLSLRQFFL